MITSIVVGLVWGGLGGKRGWSFWYTMGAYVPVYVAAKLVTHALTGSTEWP